MRDSTNPKDAIPGRDTNNLGDPAPDETFGLHFEGLHLCAKPANYIGSLKASCRARLLIVDPALQYDDNRFNSLNSINFSYCTRSSTLAIVIEVPEPSCRANWRA